MSRKLATIQKIISIKPIENSDNLELARVNNWDVVINKSQYSVGDLCVYCEIDSFLPIKDEFEFLRKTSFKKMGDLEGFRLRTIKLRGVTSQGLILPTSILNESINEDHIGLDVTDSLGIVKYEAPIPANLNGVAIGLFPNFLIKTDAERIQNLTEKYDDYKKEKFYVTEKMDGTSVSFYIKDGVFGVCSRNLDLAESDDNSYWSMAKKYKINEILKSLGKNICLQGEIIGEGIQKNKYKIKGQNVMFFNMFDIDDRKYYTIEELIRFAEDNKLETVPIIEKDFRLPETIDELLSIATNYSTLNKKQLREGIVIRTNDMKISFKVISNEFLLKE